MSIRFASRLVAIAAAFGLVACGGDPSSTTGTAAKAGTAAVPAGASTPAAAAAAVAEADRAAAMKAAGYQMRKGEWMASCAYDEKPIPAESWYGVESSEFADWNGDGAPEAIINGGNSYCFGMTGSGFTALRKKGAAWEVIAEGSGMAGLYERKGIAYPDIEIGGPGSYCFTFLRWNGSEYVVGGTSVGGKICEVRKPSAAMPLPVGYYVHTVACEDSGQSPTFYVGYLGRDRFVEAASGDFVSFTKTGPKRYRQTISFPSEEGGPASRVSDDYVVDSDSSFTRNGEQWQYCPTDRLPKAARLLDSPDFRDDPNFVAARG